LELEGFRGLDLSSAKARATRRLVGWTPLLAMEQELRRCQVVKERGYLIDNLCRSIISRRGNEIKEKVDGP